MKIHSNLIRVLSSHWFVLLLVTLFGICAVKALFHPGLFTAHDIWHQVARFYHYNQALLDGQFLPQWVSTLSLGYGYPLFIFSYHFPWLLGVPLLRLGFDLFLVLKILFGGAFILAGLSMYGLTYSVTKQRFAALVAAVIYIWSPSHFLALFVTASIGTVFAFALVPLLFWGIFLAAQSKPKLGAMIVAISVASLILTHLMTFALVAPFAVAWALLLLIRNTKAKNAPEYLVKIIKNPSWRWWLIGLVIGTLITAFYLVPLFTYLPNTNVAEPRRGFSDLYKNNLVTLRQLLYSKWGFSPIVHNAKDGEISLQIGIAQWLAVAMFTSLLLWLGWRKKVVVREVVFSLGLTALFGLTIFLMIDASFPLWKLVNQVFAVDYPFRLLLMSVMLASLLTGVVLSHLPSRVLQLLLGAGLICVALYTNRNHVRVNEYTDFPLQLYVDSETTTTTFHEYLPKGTEIPKKLPPGEWIHEVIPGLKITNVHQSTTQLSFDIESPVEKRLTLRHFVFPGIHVYQDGQEITYGKNQNGYVQIQAPAGKHTYVIKYIPESNLRSGYIISGIALVVLIAFIFYTAQPVNSVKGSKKK